MVEMLFVAPAVHPSVHQIRQVDHVGRLVSFRLVPGAALPETRNDPVLVVAVTDLELRVGALAGRPDRLITLQAGDAHLLESGVAGIKNVGPGDVQFSLIDLRTTP